jgi:hypothetical protein
MWGQALWTRQVGPRGADEEAKERARHPRPHPDDVQGGLAPPASGLSCGSGPFQKCFLTARRSDPFLCSMNLRLLGQLDVSHPEAVDGLHQRLELAQLHWLAQIAVRLKLIAFYNIRLEV